MAQLRVFEIEAITKNIQEKINDKIKSRDYSLPKSETDCTHYKHILLANKQLQKLKKKEEEIKSQAQFHLDEFSKNKSYMYKMRISENTIGSIKGLYKDSELRKNLIPYDKIKNDLIVKLSTKSNDVESIISDIIDKYGDK